LIYNFFHCATALQNSGKPAKVSHDFELMRNTRNYMRLRNIKNLAWGRAQLMGLWSCHSRNQCPETNPEI